MPRKLLLLALAWFSTAALHAQSTTRIDSAQLYLGATFASPPAHPLTNTLYLFSDAVGAGVCSGGGSSWTACVWNGAGYVSPSGGAGFVTLATGNGTPLSNCTAPSPTNLAEYMDTTNGERWWCYAANSWKRVVSVTATGPYSVTGGTQSAPAPPSSGNVLCYFDSTSTNQVCLDATGDAFQMVKGIANPSDSNVVGYIDQAGVQHRVAQSGGGGGGFSGTASLGVVAIPSGSCTLVTVAQAGVLTSDVITASFAADPTSTTGYMPSTGGMLTVIGFPTANNINFKVCNNTTLSVTPGASLTVNWADGKRILAFGTATLGTSLIASGACAAAVTVSSALIGTGNVINWSFNGDPTSLTGYTPSTNGMLTIIQYPTSANANFKVCNNTLAGITPSAVTLNWSAQ